MDNLNFAFNGVTNGKRFLLRYIFLISAGLFLSIIFYYTIWPEKIYAVHSILELICMYIELSIFLTAWNAYKNISNILFFAGFGFLAVVVFDSFHCYHFLVNNLTGHGYEDLALRYSMMGRLTASATLLLFTLNFKIKLVNRTTLLLFTVLLSIGISYLIMTFPQMFPVLKKDGQYTSIKILLEAVVIIFALCSIYSLKKNSDRDTLFYNEDFLMALLLIIPTEIILTLTGPFISFFIILGHILKAMCYLYLYKGIVKNIIILPYGKIESRYKNLEEKLNEITYLREAKVNAEMDSRNKSEYIANLSHELRTPLNVLLSGIQLFEMYMDGESSPNTNKMIKHLQSMKQNCLRQLRLVNNLIDTTKIDAGFLDLEFRMYNLMRIIENITTSLQDYVVSKKIALHYHSQLKELDMLCDVDAIERIMLNLISNAIKFTAANGMIFISVLREGENVVISVRDTGIGIPKDKLEIIFDRYKQLKDTTKKEKEGSGIGLSLTKALVELHGGTIEVASEPGVGSEFIIALPIHDLPDELADLEEIQQTSSDSEELIQIMNIEFSDIY